MKPIEPTRIIESHIPPALIFRNLTARRSPCGRNPAERIRFSLSGV